MTSDASEFRHVYACLVHERPECVLDLLENLRTLDPTSRVVLYNGGTETDLLRGLDDLTPEVLVHPEPRPMRWGYLHQFALDCFELAERSGGFDAITIVDSDQLCLRPGYSTFLREHLLATPGVGVLGTTSAEEPMTRPSSPALSAFAEIELWREFLTRTAAGLSTFPQWTFWPATVITAPAARAVSALFQNDTGLRDILQRSAIWATEEVLLPSLISALGFRVLRSPCERAFVQFRSEFTPADVDRALAHPRAYWMHPVPRDMRHPLRACIRERCLLPAAGAAMAAIRSAEILRHSSTSPGGA
jgi:hypothetical protein